MISEKQAKEAWREYRRQSQEYIVPSGVLDMLDQWADDDTEQSDDGPIDAEWCEANGGDDIGLPHIKTRSQLLALLKALKGE